jgi:uncharacterized membrane protein SirB2
MEHNITKLSDNLSAKLQNISRFVTLALALMLTGVIIMTFTHFSQAAFSGWIFASAAILTFVCLGFFVYAYFRTH